MRPVGRTSSLPRSTCSVIAASALLTFLARANGPAIAAQARDCDKAVGVVASVDGVPKGIRALIDRRVTKASALLRFHRRDDALAQMDAVTALLAGTRGQRIEDGRRAELTKSIAVLRRCLAATEPPPLATLTIRVFQEDTTHPAGEGVFLNVEGIGLGRTGSDGTFQAMVPSGTVDIEATEYPSSWGAEDVTISPGGSQVASVLMADDKEPSEESDLMLEEAPDDILPANPPSVTLKFVHDEVPVWIDRIESIELADDRYESGENVEEFFGVSDGAIHAKAPSVACRRLMAQAKIGRSLWLAVLATDSEGRIHHGSVPFQIGQFNLNVTLAPPPSNRALPVSNIPVRISVAGSEIVLRRTSDAHGRFQIDGLPDASLNFDAHVVVAGHHYYAERALLLCADRSVTLLMRSVTDVVAGVEPLTLDPGNAPCPNVARR